jgi:dsDNA-specific endonuclease/ATPase MutS2
MATNKTAPRTRSTPLAQLKEAVRRADRRAKEAKNEVKSVKKRAKQARRELKQARKDLKQAESLQSKASTKKPSSGARPKSRKKASGAAVKAAKKTATASKELRVRVANSPETRRKLKPKKARKAASDAIKVDVSGPAESTPPLTNDEETTKAA